ncbi:hypothetical protein SAY86_023094 [Trapa natans]|uniref:Uncharacterized protein n=1 Tax=Trapa natans TaxID=22666 RepID=A0AAN7LWP8_TRANT|nr:hypothetical protein SAY86_023094 [Trapa natans]
MWDSDRKVEEDEFSVLRGEGSSFIINREPSIRTYPDDSSYNSSLTRNVPFKWESQPGRAKSPMSETAHDSRGAAPAAAAINLPPPSRTVEFNVGRPFTRNAPEKGSLWSRLKIWNRVVAKRHRAQSKTRLGDSASEFSASSHDHSIDSPSRSSSSSCEAWEYN